MNEEILGYDSDGKPIYPTKKGFIYTAAFITCCKCNAAIRSAGGPRFGSVCKACSEAAQEPKP